ncbi:MAG: hypothetical protein ACOYLE_04185 [Bacteroidales bacterium]
MKDNKLTSDQKILAHWLRYILNRGMDAKNMWGIAGRVMIELVKKVTSPNALKIKNYLDPLDEENSIFKKQKGGKKNKRENNTSNENSNEYKVKYRFEIDKNEESFDIFSSRYYISDYYSIICTLEILKDYNFSITKYLNCTFEKHCEKDDNNIIRKIIFSLYLLTYFKIPKLGVDNINGELFNNAIKRSEVVRKVLNDKNIYKNAFKSFIGEKKDTKQSPNNNYETFEKDKSFNKYKIVYKEKRAWCSFRDFLKNKDVKLIFLYSLKEFKGFKAYLFNEKEEPNLNVLKQLEIPGDLWNNRPKFWKCLTKENGNNSFCINYLGNDKISPVPEKLYNLMNKSDSFKENTNYYPEQFDITFNFISRMCESGNCDVCPFGKYLYDNNEKGKNYNKLCTLPENGFCPVTLLACNYKIDCKGGDCELQHIDELKN